MQSLGTIKQLGFVVPDIEKAMTHWTAVLGVGPFFYLERAPIRNFMYRGTHLDVDISVALANSGTMQIELIQPRNDGPSMYAEFIQAGRWGLQHIAFWTERFDADAAGLQARGHELVMRGEVGVNGRFAYFDTEYHPGTILELSEVSGSKGAIYKMIHQASIGWDGSRPVREFPALT